MSSVNNPVHGQVPGFQMEEMVQGTLISKAAQTLPQTGTATLFTVAGGAIIVVSLIGMVTVATPATANTLAIGITPSSGTAGNAAICGPSSIASLAAGSVIATPSTAGAAGVSLTAPGVPVSGTPATNNYYGTVDVSLSGGTLTGVLVNGSAVGTTPWNQAGNAYSVPKHGTIAWTGSVAPTWTWTGSASLMIHPNGVISVPHDNGFIVNAGAITWTTTASVTGAIKWYLHYIPLDGTVVKGPRVS